MHVRIFAIISSMCIENTLFFKINLWLFYRNFLMSCNSTRRLHSLVSFPFSKLDSIEIHADSLWSEPKTSNFRKSRVCPSPSPEFGFDIFIYAPFGKLSAIDQGHPNHPNQGEGRVQGARNKDFFLSRISINNLIRKVAVPEPDVAYRPGESPS